MAIAIFLLYSKKPKRSGNKSLAPIASTVQTARVHSKLSEIAETPITEKLPTPVSAHGTVTYTEACKKQWTDLVKRGGNDFRKQISEGKMQLNTHCAPSQIDVDYVAYINEACKRRSNTTPETEKNV